MILNNLYITKNTSWDAFPDRYTGSVTFTSPRGEVKVNVSSTISVKILAILAEEMVTATKEVAAVMTSDILEQVSFPTIGLGQIDQEDDIPF